MEITKAYNYWTTSDGKYWTPSGTTGGVDYWKTNDRDSFKNIVCNCNLREELMFYIIELRNKYRHLENIVKEKYHISDEEFNELIKIGE